MTNRLKEEEEGKKKEKNYASKLNKIIENFNLEVNPLESPVEDEEPILDEDSEETEEVEEFIEQETEEKQYVLEPSETPVYLNWRAFKRMIGYATRYANENMDKDEWREVYGILIGSVDEETLVVVKDAIPLCTGGKTGVELEPVHYVDLSQIDESIYEQAIQNEKTDFIVGWWHTHPSFGFFFSEVDCYTHLGYQAPDRTSVV